MKSEHRHELETNQLAQWLGTRIEDLKPYSRAIVGSVVAVLILFVVYSLVKNREQGRTEAAADQLITALQSDGTKELQDTIDFHKGTPQAAVAQLALAESLLDTGLNTLFTNKPAGRESLSKAVDAFLLAQQETRDPMLQAWALYGLGRARESLGELEKAKADYKQLFTEYADSALADTAKKHFEALSKPSEKEFYVWFETQTPRPPSPDSEPGIPGMKPAFDLNNPATMGDLKLSSPLAPDLVPDAPKSPETPDGAAKDAPVDVPKDATVETPKDAPVVPAAPKAPEGDAKDAKSGDEAKDDKK